LLGALVAALPLKPLAAAWGGFPAQDIRLALREVALVRKLPEWHRQLKHLLDPPKAR
jgi:UDP-3-O-[3-hydroxymyristoyl] glucosamine N-acyltransferase